MVMKYSYKNAGVDINAGEDAVKRIKSKVRSTFSPHVLTDIGKFGGFFALDMAKYDQPVLVSSIDGVGTKLKVASLMNKHDTIGEDLVNHCVNDILAGGASPLFFLDYIGTGRLHPVVIEAIVTGMVRGCRETGCSLIGGEMAEMPGFYQPGDYDVAGAIVGVVEKSRIIDGKNIQKGDVLLGLSSNGLHTNGYSLARKVLFEKAGLTVDTHLPGLGGTVGEALLRIHRCYLSPVSRVLEKLEVRGLSHITGGGLMGNTRRILPEGCDLDVDWNAWPIPAIFELIQKEGNIGDEEMRKTFNLGIGYVVIVPRESAEHTADILSEQGESPVVIGQVI